MCRSTIPLVPGPRRRRHRVIAALALALLLGLTGSVAAGGFAAGATTNFTTVAGPRCVVTGDLNGDGILDMVAPGAGGSGVSVYLGLGGGAFSGPVSFAANASGVPALGDFNLDGRLDIAVPLPTLGFIQIYDGHGDGTFTSGAVFSTPPNAEFLVCADFNGDGKADLATCGNSSPSTGTARVFLNTTTTPGGIVTFASTDVAVAAQPRGIAIGQNLFGFDRLDLVTANTTAGSVSLLQNDGTGHFGNRLDIATQKSCYAITTGFLWTDEVIGANPRPQIVTANKDSAAVSVVRFNTNTSAWGVKKYATAANPLFVSLGDTDGNANLDIVTACYSSNVVSVLSPSYDGTPNLKPHVDIPVGTHPWSASVVNFDGDMKPDLLVAVSGNNRVSLVHGAPKMGWALGDTIPTFTAKNQYDNTYSSSSMAGQWTLLEFCSGWCGPCRLYMAPQTQSAWLNWYHHPTVTFEYVTALDDGNVVGTPSIVDDAMAWSQQYGITRPVLHSSGLATAGAEAASYDAETSATPTLRLIDPSGRVVWFHPGAVDDTTIARVVANAAGVSIPASVTPWITGGTETVTSGAQQASSPYDPGEYTFPFNVTGFGYDFTSNFSAIRFPNNTETWVTSLTYWPDPDSLRNQAFPTTSDWQITISGMQLDPAPRTVPPGTMATVVATDSFGVDHALAAPVSVSWVGNTLTYGAIPHAALAALPPLRMFTLTHTMQFTGFVAGVGDPVSATLEFRAPAPNPAQGASRLAWSQPRAGNARLDVFDVTGRHVRTLTDGPQSAGAHRVSWDLTDANGARVGSGLYFSRLMVAGEKPLMQRITVVR